jgi:hypothetical protein
MTSDPVLRQIDSEISALEAQLADTVELPPFCYVVHSEEAALSDVARAVAAIDAEQEARTNGGAIRRSVTIVPGIKDAVEEVLAAKHPPHVRGVSGRPLPGDRRFTQAL